MQQILARIKAGQLWDFPGGITPPGRKALSNASDIQTLPLADHLYLPVKQHIGVEGHVIVKTGERVLKGQALTHSSNPFAVPVHAPTSGTIGAIGGHVSAHPSGIDELTIELVVDHQDEAVQFTPMSDYQQRPKISVLEAICQAGISGMGGAGFPTHIKVAPKKNVEFLVINGVECEPYITSDDRLMRERAWQIRQGIDILQHLLNPACVVIAIEDNKPDAIRAMEVVCQDVDDYQVAAIPTKYPAGGEKQLIQVLTNREVPSGGLPIDVGVIMQNVGTCYAIADAILNGRPLLDRVVTLTGDALDRPINVWAPLGTPIRHLLTHAQYQAGRQSQPRIIMGGPMMGFTLKNDLVPVIKTTNCILVPTEQELPPAGPEQACIRCGACADACPAGLLPQQLYWHSKAKDWDKAQEYNLFDCIECGACAFVCPSDIPLVQYYRQAKADIRTEEEERDKADKARERFEARQQRLERDKQEREAKQRAAAEARQRAAAERAEKGSGDDRVAAAIARAKAKKAAQAGEAGHSADTSGDTAKDDKKAAVAAAIARAKAKKAAQAGEAGHSADASGDTAKDDKKAAVAAAIARAKAKRAAKAGAAVSSDNNEDQAESDLPPSQPKDNQ